MTINANLADAEAGGEAGKVDFDGEPIGNFWKFANILVLAGNVLSGTIKVTWEGGRDGATPDDPFKNPTKFYSYFEPFGPFFAIWLLIYATEFAFVGWQALQKPGVAPQSRIEMIRSVSPWWCLAHIITIIWEFVPKGWPSAACLTLVGACLFTAQSYVKDAKEGQDFYCLHWPISLHTGWMMAAMLVTWTLFIRRVSASVTVNLLGLAEAVVITCFFAYAAWVRRSATIMGVLAWASVGVALRTWTADHFINSVGTPGTILIGTAELGLGAVFATLAWSLRHQPAVAAK